MITVTIDLKEYAEGSIEDRIVEAVSSETIKRMMEHIQKRVDGIIDGAVQEEIAALASQAVEKILDDKIQTTNSWGKPEGPAIPFRDHVVRAVEKIIRGKVDSNGRPSTSSYNDDLPFIDWAVKRIAYKEIENIKADVATEVKKKIGDGTRAAIVESVSQAVLKSLAKSGA